MEQAIRDAYHMCKQRGDETGMEEARSLMRKHLDDGWDDFKSFTRAKNADQWLTSFILENEYSPEDFTIVTREEN